MAKCWFLGFLQFLNAARYSILALALLRACVFCLFCNHSPTHGAFLLHHDFYHYYYKYSVWSEQKKELNKGALGCYAIRRGTLLLSQWSTGKNYECCADILKRTMCGGNGIYPSLTGFLLVPSVSIHQPSRPGHQWTNYESRQARLTKHKKVNDILLR